MARYSTLRRPEIRALLGTVMFAPWIARGGIAVLRTRKFGQHATGAAMMGPT